MRKIFTTTRDPKSKVPVTRLMALKVLVIIIVTAGSMALGWHVLPAGSLSAITLAAFCLLLWATAIMPEAWVALLFMLIASVLNVAPSEVVFSGFSSPTFWLFFSGLILSAATTHTGLGTFLSPFLGRIMGRSYAAAVAGCVFSGILLSFILPSAVVRMMLLLPVVGLVAKEVGYHSQSNGRVGMMLAAAFGTFLPAFTILPANTPNMILVGATEAIYGLRLSYFDYLLLHFPVLGFLKGLCLIGAILILFPAPAPEKIKQKSPQKLLPHAKRLAFLLVCTLGLWLTDGVHGISPAWIGLSAALICLVPSFGFVRAKCLKEDVGLAGLLFLAGLLGLGAVVAETGLGSAVTAVLQTMPKLTAPSQGAAILVGLGSFVGIATNLASIPVILTPLADSLADYTGLSMKMVLMTQVVAFSTPLLPYQVPPLIVAKEVGNLSLSVITKLCLTMLMVTILILLPLDLVWWSLLGRL